MYLVQKNLGAKQICESYKLPYAWQAPKLHVVHVSRKLGAPSCSAIAVIRWTYMCPHKTEVWVVEFWAIWEYHNVQFTRRGECELNPWGKLRCNEVGSNTIGQTVWVVHCVTAQRSGCRTIMVSGDEQFAWRTTSFCYKDSGNAVDCPSLFLSWRVVRGRKVC